MRHDYDLTNETRQILSGNVIDTAAEMNVADKYLYAILAGTQTDPFAKFEHLYAASVRAGGRVGLWDNKLAAIRARYEKEPPCKSPIECLTEKISSDADTTSKLVDALKDGEIDAREAEKIQAAIDKERSTLDMLEIHLQFKRELRVA